MNRRIVIDRLDLDLRGIDPELARRAVQRLAPALRARLASQPQLAAPASAGQAMETQATGPDSSAASAASRESSASAAPATPDTLAAHLAQQIVRRLPGS